MAQRSRIKRGNMEKPPYVFGLKRYAIKLRLWCSSTSQDQSGGVPFGCVRYLDISKLGI